MRLVPLLVVSAGTVALACVAAPPVTVTVTVWEDEETTTSTSSTAQSHSTEQPSLPATTTIAVAESQTSTSSEISSPAVESPLPATTETPSVVDIAPPTTTLLTVTTSSTPPASTSSASTSDNTSDTSSETSSDSSAAVSGESTFYGGNLSGGMCSFTTYTLPSGLFGTAFSGSAWDSAANCGACVKVTGPSGNSITAMIVDQCPECDAGHLDLFQNAFAGLGSISAGIISTSYTFVPCGITSPIRLHNKSGTSQYWFSMQVVNANEPVASLEVSTDGGSMWQATTRAEYNFFENQSGFGTSTVDVRVTSTNGKSIVVSQVSVASDSEVTGTSNF